MQRIDLDSKYLEGTIQHGALRVVINRPERRNACTIEMYHGIKKAAVLADKDPAIDALVITGVGDVFCVGRRDGWPARGGRRDRPRDRWPRSAAVPPARVDRARSSSPPSTACARAAASTWCCAATSPWRPTAPPSAPPSCLRGVADPFLPARLPARVGVALAKYLLFTAASIDARRGRAHRPGGQGRCRTRSSPAHVEWVLEQIRLTGPAARAAVKQDINRHLPPFDIPMFAESLRSPEVAEGFQAFVEKRPPKWPRWLVLECGGLLPLPAVGGESGLAVPPRPLPTPKRQQARRTPIKRRGTSAAVSPGTRVRPRRDRRVVCSSTYRSCSRRIPWSRVRSSALEHRLLAEAQGDRTLRAERSRPPVARRHASRAGGDDLRDQPDARGLAGADAAPESSRSSARMRPTTRGSRCVAP